MKGIKGLIKSMGISFGMGGGYVGRIEYIW